MFRADADDCKGGVNCSMSVSQRGQIILSKGRERTTPPAHWDSSSLRQRTLTAEPGG